MLIDHLGKTRHSACKQILQRPVGHLLKLPSFVLASNSLRTGGSSVEAQMGRLFPPKCRWRSTMATIRTSWSFQQMSSSWEMYYASHAAARSKTLSRWYRAWTQQRSCSCGRRSWSLSRPGSCGCRASACSLGFSFGPGSQGTCSCIFPAAPALQQTVSDFDVLPCGLRNVSHVPSSNNLKLSDVVKFGTSFSDPSIF